MKTVSTAIELAGKVCWLCVNIAVALWAVRLCIRLARGLREEISNRNRMTIHGTIM